MSSDESDTLEEYEGVLSDIFSSRAVSQIMDFFLDHKEFDYSPGEIAKKQDYHLEQSSESYLILRKTS